MLKIPAQYSIGYNERSGLPAKLGYATHHVGKSLEKLSGFHTWIDKKLGIDVIDNDPIEGFKLLTTTQRDSRWGSGRHVWRVLDPRGFVLEISSECLEYLISHCDIIAGIIQGKCVWAWDGKDKGLLSINTSEYKKAFANTKRVNKTVPLREINRGDIVLLHDGKEATYWGGLYVFRKNHTGSRYNGDGVYDYTKCVRTYITQDVKTKAYTLQSSVKVSEVVAKVKKTITTDEVCKKMNKRVYDGWRKSPYRSDCKVTEEIIFVPKKTKFEDLTIVRKPVDISGACVQTDNKEQYSSHGKMFFASFLEIDCEYNGRKQQEIVRFEAMQRLKNFKNRHHHLPDSDPAIKHNGNGACTIMEFDIGTTGKEKRAYFERRSMYNYRHNYTAPNFQISDGKVNIGAIDNPDYKWFQYVIEYDDMEFIMVKGW